MILIYLKLKIGYKNKKYDIILESESRNSVEMFNKQ